MIINDPVFGFIEVEKGLLSNLVKHPYFIRLSRIKQLGPTFYVFPGAVHTRFQHSIGTLHLAEQALCSLEEKGTYILENEHEGTKAAMLLHDLGHGPMSHALEGSFVEGISHEEISLALMERINQETNGRLDTAIRIFKNTYPKKFLHELICSQLDMDRMDYLCRDSFFTGVREGNIGVARIIKMLDVKDDRLVVEHKGIYTIENYLMARRLMYWQVYLHKTCLAAQEILKLAMKRARELMRRSKNCLPASDNLNYFLSNRVDKQFRETHPEWLDHFIGMDDTDVELALKEWCKCKDKVLSLLANNYINRNLFKVLEVERPVTPNNLEKMKQQMSKILSISVEDANYFIRDKEIDQMLYSTTDDHICISHKKDGTISDISQFSELIKSDLTDKKSRRYYLFYQRQEEHFEPQP